MDYADRLERVRRMTIEDGQMEDAVYVEEKALELMPGVATQPAPAHCEVRIRMKPTKDSDILVEFWLPVEGWNGDFLGTGNGGSAGVTQVLELMNGIRRGYATASSDLGTAPDVDDLIGKPERWKDFGHRSIHLMTVVGKQVTECFYGQPVGYSLFVGGSTGGQQGMMLAQRYPEDYDGILAVAPANHRTHLHYGFIWNWLALTETEKSGLTQEDAQAVTEFMLQEYGREGECLPGDAFFTCPQQIKLVSEVFEKSGRLNREQKEALKKLVKGAVDPVTGETVYPPLYVPGSEACPLGLETQSDKETFAHDYFYIFRWVYGKEFDFKKFDFHEDVKRLDEALGEYLNADSTDLSAYRASGGKLLMLHGMADPIIPYTDSLDYYRSVVRKMGGLDSTREFFRYFPIPGLAHVSGGPGVQDIVSQGFRATPKDREHDALTALAEWVRGGNAPEVLKPVAFKDCNLLYGITMDTYEYERPCYAYPYYAAYKGGDVNDVGNYERREWKE